MNLSVLSEVFGDNITNEEIRERKLRTNNDLKGRAMK
jgi:hypothetical protein